MDVLVVENDVSLLSYIIELIQGWGYHAERSETGQDTLKKVNKRKFDLVLLDTSLPDMRAQDLIKRLKELQAEIRIVTMTESNTKGLEDEIRTLGIIFYMSKPISENVLKEILDHISIRKRKETKGSTLEKSKE